MQFEVGQEVAIRSGFGYADYRIVIVERITPSGQITVSGSARRFNPDGFVRGNSTERLVLLTDELRATIRRKELVEQISTTKWPTLPLETLEAVAALLS